MKNYYEILGVSRDSSKAEIQAIFYKLAHIYNPDGGGNEWKFKEIIEAWNVLSDDEKRAEYNTSFNQLNQNHKLNPEHHYNKPITESPKHEKVYEVSNKIKSSKWNAFLLDGIEVEEYLVDGVHIQNGGFFSSFTKEKRDDNARREKRINLLVNQRIVNISNEYLRRNTTPLEKEIISAIIEPTKNIFNQGVSYVWKASFKNDDSLQCRLQGLIEKEKKESGDVVACFPIIGGVSEKILFITTNGICLIAIPVGSEQAILALSAGQQLGLIGYAFGALAGLTFHKYKMSKIQKKFIELITIYPPSLLAQCLHGSQYIPYDMINILTYSYEKEGSTNGVISLIYANAQQEFLKVTRDIILDIVKILSADSPPKKKIL